MWVGRGSCVARRGSCVARRGSCAVGRASWVVRRGPCVLKTERHREFCLGLLVLLLSFVRKRKR